MINRYPARAIYETQYARYLEGADKLLKLAGVVPGECVLDLCAGGLRQSYAALDMGAAAVAAVERELSMMEGHPPREKLRIIWSSVEKYLDRPIDGFQSPVSAALFDVIACQNAVNNWFGEKMSGKLYRHLYSNPIRGTRGRFVFNTFNKKPSAKPQVSEYWMEGDRKYAEVVYTIGDTVHHVQSAEGFEPHCTTFRWISRDQYTEWLSPYFDVTVTTENNTDLYLCAAKPKDQCPND